MMQIANQIPPDGEKKMIQVVVTVDTQTMAWELLAPHGARGVTPKIGNCQFHLNPAKSVNADFWIVFANARPKDWMVCARENTLFIVGEPESKKVYPREYYAQFHRIIDTHHQSNHPRVTLHAPCLRWQFGFNHRTSTIELGYDALASMPPPESVLNKVSVVCSNAAHTPGQRQRLAFLGRLKERLGDRLIHFGRGFEPIDDKAAAIQGHRIHLVMENCQAPHYWTEKILDAYLGWSFPAYVGCPNLEDYFPRDSFLDLNIQDPTESADRLVAMLESPRTTHEIQAISNARSLVLNQYNPWTMWAHWAEKFYDPEKKSRNLCIRSHKAFRPFPMGLMYRMKTGNQYHKP